MVASGFVSASADGVVVEGLGRELQPDVVGLRSGDVIVRWMRGDVGGVVRSPFDLRRLAVEQLPRGELIVNVERDGQRLTVTIPPRAWPFEIEVRPALEPDDLARYEQGRALVADKKTEDGVQRWRDAIEARGNADGVATCWLWARIGTAWADAGRRPDFEAAYKDALACGADRADPTVIAGLRVQQAAQAQEHNWLDLAESVSRTLLEDSDAAPLAMASALVALGRARYFQGHTSESIALFRQAVPIQESEAPESLALARTLNALGLSLTVNGEPGEAESFFARAEALSARLGPGTRPHLAALTGLGGAIADRGDWITTQRLWERALDLSPPNGPDQALLQVNLGVLAFARGDLEAAESWGRQALALSERLGTRKSYVAQLGSLGGLAMARGDLDQAERLLRQALAEEEAVDPYVAVELRLGLGRIHLLRSDRAGAKAWFERALGQSEKGSIGGVILADCLLELADLARLERDWPAAEASYRRALSAETTPDPIGPQAARILHGLGTVERARGRDAEAVGLFARAVGALEGMRGRTGNSDEARSLFDSQYYGVYHDHAEQLIRLGRVDEAYDVLELSRARSLLALLSERDLLLDDEIPPALEQARRRIDAEYQRTHEDWLRLEPAKDGEKARSLSLRLTNLRQQQATIAAKVRDASPRLADARYPDPMSAADIRASLEPGTLLIAYSVGEEATVLFALGSAASGDALDAVVIPMGQAELGRRLEGWRREIEKGVPRPAFYTEARALYDLLLRPMDARVRAAKRLLISPSGSLHALPFAALMRQGQYLAEWKPVAIVPSGTLHARAVQSRKGRPPACMLVGFADPQRPAADRSRLPESRREVEAVAGVCPKHVLHVGDAATEERAKRLPKQACYVHFACHAIVSERLPLDSGLVLQAGSRDARSAGDDGLLQAWEIYERVRVDAELVTLSACDSGSGKQLGGEGLMGLARAFQYAGARSVVASLWSVSDRSTVELMRTFYEGLSRGLAKDEALRRAQVTAIRNHGVGSRPLRWAGFQLFGDWK